MSCLPCVTHIMSHVYSRSRGELHALNYDSRSHTAIHTPLHVQFLQGVSITCYAEPCISHGRVVRLSVHPSVCHMLAPWTRLPTFSLRGAKTLITGICVINFELAQPIRPRYVNVTDGQTDGRTDGRLTIAIPRFALRESRGKNVYFTR